MCSISCCVMSPLASKVVLKTTLLAVGQGVAACSSNNGVLLVSVLGARLFNLERGGGEEGQHLSVCVRPLLLIMRPHKQLLGVCATTTQP